MVADMQNKLAVIQRGNVAALMAHCEMSNSIFAGVTSLSPSTIGSSFGKGARTAPSEKSLSKIYEAFDLEPGILDLKDTIFNDDTEMVIPVRPDNTVSARPRKMKVPTVIEQTEINIQIGKTTIHTHIPAARAKRVLAFIILGGEDLEE